MCPDSLFIIYTGATVCADRLVKQYPHQGKEKVKIFNEQVKAWLAVHHPSVVFLDPYNVTLHAMNPPSGGAPRSSDGFHFLSDFNIAYASILLNLMHTFQMNATSS
jgi:hypothetical protein